MRSGVYLLAALATAASGALGSSAAAQDAPATSTATAGEPSKFFSKEDGWLDVSGFLDEKYGFLPIVRPITEPAVGFGAAGGLAFISKPFGDARAGLGRPDITFVGGMGTENGTWAAFIGDMRYWLDDRLQTQVAVLRSSVNLKFYGLGDDDQLSIHPLSYTVDVAGAFVQGRFRPFDLPLWGGLGYAFFRTEVDFDLKTPASAVLPKFEHTEDLGALVPAIVYDSRDTMFTPRQGVFAEAKVAFFSPYFGGDSDFQRLQLVAIQYFPVHPALTLGFRVDAAATFGGAPFYLNPYVDLRGAAAFRYQGEEVASLETELRWQVWQRWSLVGFAGAGAAWNDFDDVRDYEAVVTGGVGFRYEIARAYGIHMGLDLAFGPEEVAVYVQFGSAWSRA